MTPATTLTMPAAKAEKPQRKKVDERVPKFFYRRDEAAFALGMSERAIDYMIANQTMKTRRVGRVVLIPAGDVERVAARILKSDMVEGVYPERATA